MTPERWLAVVELFGEVVGRDEAERETLLRERCGDDEELRRSVVKLLDADREADSTGFLSADPLAAGGDIPYRLDDFGDYEQIEYLGRGGMGVVYRAHKISLNKTLALKMCLSQPLAPAASLRRFRAEAEAMALLDHPNIVPVYDVGEHRGATYIGMKLLTGGDLEARKDRYRDDPRAAVELLLVLANALRFAHQHGILHRDLKPANVLFDEEDRPHVGDLGLARRLDTDATLTQSGTVTGTAAYMAPEQARGETRSLTWATDVYGLGVILYELLSGQPPLRGETVLETLRLVAEEPAPPLRSRNRKVDRDLETIVAKCLEKAPEARYPSAKALADDLRRWLAGEPLEARPIGPLARFGRWCRRHPGTAVGTLASAALTLLLILVAVQRATETVTRRAEILDGNGYVARLVADVLLHRLQELSEPVARAAGDDSLRQLLEDRDGAGIRAWVDRLPASPAIENWHVFDAAGVLLARTPDHAVVGQSFAARDYFTGAFDHVGEPGRRLVHVSRAYRSVADGFVKFNLVVPVVGAEGVRLGLVGVAITTDANWGLTHLDDDRRVVGLVAPGDPSRRDGDPEPPPEHLVLLHDAYSYGENAVAFEREEVTDRWPRRCPHELEPYPASGAPFVLSDYRDPLGEASYPRFRGRWLAGFAPVGQTGFFVLVQRRDEGGFGAANPRP